MTQSWVNQVVGNLCSMSNKDFRTVWHKKLFMTSWHNSKTLCEYC